MANTSKRKRGRGLILAGLLLLAAALALVLYNLWDAWRAEKSVAQALEALRQETALSQEEPSGEAPAGEQSPQKDSQEQPMATVEAEGREYLGELRFPTLDLTLPMGLADIWTLPLAALAAAQLALLLRRAQREDA